MVAPGFLQNGLVLAWLGGILPAWTLLDAVSFSALRQAPSDPGAAIRLRTDTFEADLSSSTMVRNTIILLQHAAESAGLRLTATGNLTRTTVADMIPRMEWPGFDEGDMYRFNKVINEPDFAPLHIVRVTALSAQLLRTRRGRLVITKSGQDMLSPGQQGALLARLATTMFWKQSLAEYGRHILGAWPQADIGVVLWSLCVSATDWQSPDALARLCTIPVNGILGSDWDIGATLLEARILRPLLWLGLIEHRQEATPGSPLGRRHFYRKMPLFDKLIAFDITLEAPAGSIQ